MIASPVEVRPLPPRLQPLVFAVIVLAAAAFCVPSDNTLAMWIRVLVPIGCATAIAVVSWLWWRRRQTRILVDSNGIHVQGMLRRRQIAWNDVTRYRYFSVKQPSVAHGRGGAGMLGLVTGALAEGSAQKHRAPNRYFGLGYVELHTTDSARPFRIGKHTFFGPQGGYVDLTRLIELILEELHERLTGSTAFSPFTLDATTLRHANATSIDLADILHVSLAKGRLHIASRTHGQWAAASTKTIDNSMLLVQQLASRGVRLQLSPEVFVPQTTLSLLSR